MAGQAAVIAAGKALAAEIYAADVEAAVIDAGRGDVWVSSPLSDVIKREGAALIESTVGTALVFVMATCLSRLQLDKDAPFSDASLSGLLSRLLNVQVASVKDRAGLKAAFRAAVTKKFCEKTGLYFEDVFNRELVRRDMLRAMGQRAGDLVPGLALRDLSDKAATLDDAALFAGQHLSALTGCTFTNLRSSQAIKEDIYAFAAPIVREQLGAEAGQCGSDYARAKKMDKRSIRNREAQQRFVEKHGNRKQYIRLT